MPDLPPDEGRKEKRFRPGNTLQAGRRKNGGWFEHKEPGFFKELAGKLAEVSA